MSIVTEVDARPEVGRVLIRVQLGLVLAYVIAVGTALGRAAAFAGHLYLPRQGDSYTANAWVWPGLWRGVWSVLMVVLGLGPLLSLLVAGVGVVALGSARARRGPAWWWLLASTVVSVVVAAFALLPGAPGNVIFSWVLD